MANPEHLVHIKEGVTAWNTWRKSVPEVEPDLRWENLSLTNLRGINLSKTNLSRANLSGAMLSRANLSGARLLEASLNEANLSGADLSGAVLKRANLSRANLSRTTLTGAILHHAILRKTDLFGATLREADLKEAFFYETAFRDTNLAGAIGLEQGRHFGPSSIDLHTLARTPNLPTAFLRGCGLSSWEIEATRLYAPTLTADQITDLIHAIERLRSSSPMQRHNLFISYSHADAPFVERLTHFLYEREVLYWHDIHDTPSGSAPKIVTRAMRQDPLVLVVLSRQSAGKGWVDYEISQARTLEHTTNRTVLCLVALDDSWTTADWSDEVHAYLQEQSIFDCSPMEDETTLRDRFDDLLARLPLFYETMPSPAERALSSRP